MKTYKKFVENAQTKQTYIVTYDGRYGKRVSATSPEEAIKLRDEQTTMKNKKKITKFSYDKYEANLVK
jgi:hypothetical protein